MNKATNSDKHYKVIDFILTNLDKISLNLISFVLINHSYRLDYFTRIRI